MKLAYLSAAVLPSAFANGVHIMKMAAGFAACGLDVTLFATDWPDPDGVSTGRDVFAYYGVPETFRIERLPMVHPRGSTLRYLAGTFGYTRRIHRSLRELRPDAAHGRYLPGCLAAAKLGVPVIFEAHGPVWEHRLEWQLFRQLTQMPAFRGVAVISDALRRMYAERGAVDPEQIIVAHDGADPVPGPETPADWPGREGALQVGYTGSLHPGRGIGLIRTLARRLPDMDFHLVGGSPEDIAVRRAEGVPETLHFHGRVDPDEVYRYRNACDVLLAPYQRSVSLRGGGNTAGWMSPLKVFEYMASRRAVVASDLPVLREVLRGGAPSFSPNCMLADPDSPEEWETALRTLRDWPELREALADAAYADFEAEYRWDSRARRFAGRLGAVSPAGGPEARSEKHSDRSEEGSASGEERPVEEAEREKAPGRSV